MRCPKCYVGQLERRPGFKGASDEPAYDPFYECDTCCHTMPVDVWGERDQEGCQKYHDRKEQ